MKVQKKRTAIFYSVLVTTLSATCLTGCDKKENSADEENDGGIGNENDTSTEGNNNNETDNQEDERFTSLSTLFKEEYKDVSTGLSRDAIIGSWRMEGDFDEVWQFNEDGTMIEYWSDDGWRYDDTWAIEGNLLATRYIDEYEHENDDGDIVKSKETSVEVCNSAIVDDRFYYDVMVKVSGAKDSLDGKWVSYFRDIGKDEEGGEIKSRDEYGSAVFDIDGDQFSFVFETRYYDDESDSDEEGRYYDKNVEGSGIVRTDGEKVYYTVDEKTGWEGDMYQLWFWIGSNGANPWWYEIDEEEYRDENTEYMLGHFVSANVIVLVSDYDEPLEDLAYVRDK
jgi:hypothetical protein